MSKETETAKVLGLLADRIVRLRPKAVMQSDLDEIVVTLRRGEAVILDMMPPILVANPHDWTPDEKKNFCVICGDGPWGRHRFQMPKP